MAGARPDTWMPMYWGDYLKDTGHLSAIEHGAYFLLIGHYWSSGVPLPDDDAKLRRIAKVESAAQWRRLRPVLASFFKVGNGAWQHGRVDKELAAAAKRSSDAKAKAKRAADARWQGQHDDIPEASGGQDDDEQDAPGMQQASHADAPGMPQAYSENRALAHSAQESQRDELNNQTTEILPSVSQPVENAEKPDACSNRQAMLEDCPSQPQSSSPGQIVETSKDLEEDSSASARDIDTAFAEWSQVAYALKIPDPGFLNGERRKLLADCLAECGLKRWMQAMANLRNAEWLRDERDPSKPLHWVNLPNIIKPETFMGLLENRYAERHAARTRSPESQPGDSPTSAGIAAAFARRSVQPGRNPGEVGTADGAAGDLDLEGRPD